MNKFIMAALLWGGLSIQLSVAQEASENTPTKKDSITHLNEVILSASREKQTRNEIPAAVGVIKSKTIQETKAFGLDQLVNQTSGVYMSTSRVASNEQHFMAVRSPISTKSLFLYLEDGLQIRPTSVFNHNALLEMNDISYERIEVLKGPASSIYGSEAIGGSFNFITKKPTKEFTGSIGTQMNNLGLKRYEVEVSDQINDKFGYYIGSHYVHRKNGPIQHSDYEKFATTIKTVYAISDQFKWTNVIDKIDYRSDMSGSLSESDYSNGNYESDQTFTERNADAIRVRSTLTSHWNNNNKTSLNLVYRDNTMDQNPSYRIRQSRNQGQLTGTGTGEVNSNHFNSYMGLLQHKINFNSLKSSLIFGGTTDYSPQKYISNKTDVIVNTNTGQNTSFTVRPNDYNLNYTADILNYAGFFQYEITPLDPLKITAALRYDRFRYDYYNRTPGVGVANSKDQYSNWTPKIGMNYNFNKKSGLYLNYSQGFTPPQVSTLYRNRNDLKDIKPSIYNNYEIGTYINSHSKWKIDGALYIVDGKNTLITQRDSQGNFFSTNAGQTRSYGFEYGITYSPTPKLSLTHNGSYAKHRYEKFFDKGVDYSNTDRETAPNLLGISMVTYKPLKQLSITAEHELVGQYNTSYEGQSVDSNGNPSTAIYDGHSIYNLRAQYQYKKIEIWVHFLNIFDDLYAARASYSSFRKENSYTIGNPRAIHAGLKFHF